MAGAAGSFAEGSAFIHVASAMTGSIDPLKQQWMATSRVLQVFAYNQNYNRVYFLVVLI
ncbi:hypothetical protein [Phyllobacterium sp. SB3]|uniref:hypothetical protein n=1 Tax=Phyllobacterium sp. SB3 TaxID=3156073 RepID=UPI0032AFB106